MWISRKNELLKECSRVVKPYGKCFLHLGGMVQFNGKISSYAHYLGLPGDFYSFGKEFKSRDAYLGSKDGVSLYQGRSFNPL
jgi:ubiquinone/menaquinone biosynthesis C-methylase UbiE